ncbi:MAG: SDR family NAD(P)-dependent oxidoreductase [Thermomicrobiales bacterium]
MGLLEGKTAVVTGGSHGIGEGIARGFAREGARVAITYRPSESHPGLILAELGANAIAVPMEAGDPTSIEAAFVSVAAAFGEIDILVSNAGYAEIVPVSEMSIAQFDRMLNVHLRGALLTVQAVLPGMIARGSGKIITISSQLAYIGAEGLAHYAAAKAGVLGFTRSLAREVIGHGINVNCIAPGAISTGILPADPAGDDKILAGIPIGRFGVVDDIVPTAILLASDGGAFYVGQVLSPNGGEVML